MTKQKTEHHSSDHYFRPNIKRAVAIGAAVAIGQAALPPAVAILRGPYQATAHVSPERLSPNKEDLQKVMEPPMRYVAQKTLELTKQYPESATVEKSKGVITVGIRSIVDDRSEILKVVMRTRPGTEQPDVEGVESVTYGRTPYSLLGKIKPKHVEQNKYVDIVSNEHGTGWRGIRRVDSKIILDTSNPDLFTAAAMSDTSTQELTSMQTDTAAEVAGSIYGFVREVLPTVLEDSPLLYKLQENS